MERLEKELNFYKKRCNDLGAKVFKLGEDLSWAKANTRRYQTTASIIQTAHSSISLNDNIKTASLNFLKIIIEKMKKRGGSIVNVTSLNSELGFSNNPGYVSSKGALKMLTKSFCVDYSKYKIRINNIGPGYIKTQMTKKKFQNI